MKDYLETDVLVIGNGIAGSTAALRLVERGIEVLMVSKGKDYTRTNTYYAQGGIAALPEGEKPELFVQDIVRAGDEFNYLPAVDQVVADSRPLVREVLIDKVRVPFSRNGDQYDLAQEGGHSTRRVLNVRDMTGRVIQDKFNEYLQKLPRLTMLFQHTAIDLLSYPHHSSNPVRIYQEPRIIGAYVLDQKSKKVTRVFARKVVLASGGLCSLFLHSTNPEEAIGNGIAMAHRAGASLANLEYIQFHPTSLYHREADSFLISEAVRGEGARLLNLKGEYFMEKYSPLKDLAPRDEVSRAIYEEMIKRGDPYVLLDLASFAKIDIRERFPTIFQTCLKYGINIEEKPIPVVPAAHYSCGGVLSDLRGRSSIRNLYAIGEVSATGVHGANRLASVSLLEALVWGVRAAEDIAAVIGEDKDPYVIAEVPEWKYPHAQEKLDPALVWQDLVTIKSILWNYNGIIRTVKRMERARADLEYLKHRIEKFYQASEIGNRIVALRDSVQTALLIAESSLRNRVSRGAHFVKSDEN
jgi:L-aspartate oxidase